jgi:SAM-dependent methyltransferase
MVGILPGMSDYDSWAADYDGWAEALMDDVAFYVELARDANEPIVELGVGTGRVAIPIAQETGKRVIGIDTSSGMLKVGRTRTGDLPIDFREGDFRDFTIGEQVDLVICPARALLHAPTWGDKRRVFESAAATLKPGDRFAWNVFVVSPFIAAENHRQKRMFGGDRWEMVAHVPSDNRVDLTRGRGERSDATVHLWWATKSEWEGLIEVSGFEIEALYGGFDSRPFDDESLEFVYVARKPA